MKTLSLIIPIYNGASYIADTMQELADFASENTWLKEVIIINDGSTDNTQKIINACQQSTYPFKLKIAGYSKNRGKACAIKTAIPLFGQVDAVAFTDVELPYGLACLEQGMDLLDTYDMVIGSRCDFIHESHQYTWYRGLTTKLFRLFLPSEVRSVKDTQCGLKIFKKGIFNILFSKIKTCRWVFDVELFIIARRRSMNVATIPVQIKQKCLHRKGGVSVIKHGVHIIFDLARIYRHIARKAYE